MLNESAVMLNTFSWKYDDDYNGYFYLQCSISPLLCLLAIFYLLLNEFYDIAQYNKSSLCLQGSCVLQTSVTG